ncbi:DUF4350 domain-containing protein [Streptomyces sp. NPDC059256]|uniref:DUF4350 domain-containing protein n=1 Tax=Streptomyces sp. NPDC059256 TaxID=3346794 RepID=UPI0036CFE6D5
MTETAPGTTSMSPTTRQVWNRTRGLLLALLIIVAGGITLAALRSDEPRGTLDPRSADRLGSRAIAELLDERGVSTRVVTTLDEATASVGRDTTLLVTNPDMLTDAQQQALYFAIDPSGGRTVLLGPGPGSIATLAPGIHTSSAGRVSPRAPQCTFPSANRAGTADLGGRSYTTGAGAGSDGCYPSDGRPTLLRLDAPNRGDTILLGSADILYNDRLAKHGNASLALQLLGAREHLVWYLPSLHDGSTTAPGDDGGNTFFELIPSGWLWATLQLTFAAVLAAIWRSRRLGPLITERLPVVVRASEATEGRARLYHQANARDHTATVLRAAARSRLAMLLRVPSAEADSVAVLIPAVAARIPSETDPTPLLFGPAPPDDAGLVLLADQLDALEREVRRS